MIQKRWGLGQSGGLGFEAVNGKSRKQRLWIIYPLSRTKDLPETQKGRGGVKESIARRRFLVIKEKASTI